jgi:predicted ATP-grasp superfamily ATP-dependent carboligase
LILTADPSVEAVSTFRNELSSHFLFSLPSIETLPTLADKALFQNYAEQQEFPVPRAVVLASKTDIPLLQHLTMPLVLKPADKKAALNGLVERAARAETLEQARTIADQMLNRTREVIAQEWIKGPDSEIYFSMFVCDKQSRVAALFSGRKIVCDPPLIGNTAVCVEAEEPAEELARLTLQFINRTAYQGIGSLEYKRDLRTDRFMIVEPTVGRTDWQEEIATLCGTNIPLISYWTELGSSFEDKLPPLPGQLAWRSSIAHRLPVGMLKKRTRVVDGYFRISDPLPGIYHYCYERFCARIWHRVTRNYRALGISMSVIRGSCGRVKKAGSEKIT